MTSLSRSALFETRELSLPGVLLITPKMFSDVRGYTVVAYNVEEFAKLGITTDFKRDLVSYSVKNVIRGLHFQHPPYREDKLVRCTQGEIFDVVADCNPASTTFGTYVSVVLTAKEQTMLYVPDTYVHGFCVTSDDAIVEYKIGGEYRPESAGGVPWNDPLLHIAWPTSTPILSEQDKSWQPLQKSAP